MIRLIVGVLLIVLPLFLLSYYGYICEERQTPDMWIRLEEDLFTPEHDYLSYLTWQSQLTVVSLMALGVMFILVRNKDLKVGLPTKYPSFTNPHWLDRYDWTVLLFSFFLMIIWHFFNAPLYGLVLTLVFQILFLVFKRWLWKKS